MLHCATSTSNVEVNQQRPQFTPAAFFVGVAALADTSGYGWEAREAKRQGKVTSAQVSDMIDRTAFFAV